MDISLSLEVNNITNKKNYISLFKKLDKLSYEISFDDKEIFIQKDIDNIQDTIEKNILFFLANIDNNFIEKYADKLRIGVFYSLNEYPFMSLEFSHQILKLLYKNKLEIEINSYPSKS